MPDVPRTCIDLDEDCPGVPCKVRCWLYDPQRGMCPYLRSDPETADLWTNVLQMDQRPPEGGR